MSAAQSKSADPSMEEILASIRRIISEDQSKASPAVAAVSVPVSTDMDDDEIMELAPRRANRQAEPEPHYIADDVMDNDLSFQDPAPPKGQDDIDALMSSFEDEIATPMMAPPMAATPSPTSLASPAPSNDRLLSNDAGHAVSSAFASLTNTVFAKNSRTVENLIEDMMRPMIKSWLDENLPVIVERLVKSEIERVARGGR
jgi:uncharacterized protein